MASFARLRAVCFVVMLSCTACSARIPSRLAQQTVSTVSVTPPPSNFPKDQTLSPPRNLSTFPTDSPPLFPSSTSPTFTTVSPLSSSTREDIWKIVLFAFAYPDSTELQSMRDDLMLTYQSTQLKTLMDVYKNIRRLPQAPSEVLLSF